MKRRPLWACPSYDRHGDTVCADCPDRYGVVAHQPGAGDPFPPRVVFGRGWFSGGATHWYDATDARTFPSRDGRRLLAQAICGGICDVTIVWAPRPGRECGKCLRAIRKLAGPAPTPTPGATAASRMESTRMLRLYRGLTRAYDPTRVGRDRRTATDFTECPHTALLYARGRRGSVLVIDVPAETPRLSEEQWLGMRAKRFMMWGGFDEWIVGELAATDLRVQIRRAGIVTAPDEDKAMILRRYVERLCLTSAGDAKMTRH